MNLPKHECGLYLEHNAYKDYYETADMWVSEHDTYDWKNDEAKARAISTGEIWTLQWYPKTPAVAAPTLDELLAFALEEE